MAAFLAILLHYSHWNGPGKATPEDVEDHRNAHE
jgi:hypothetical protein